MPRTRNPQRSQVPLPRPIHRPVTPQPPLWPLEPLPAPPVDEQAAAVAAELHRWWV